jgi:stage III sporulation protein AB
VKLAMAAVLVAACSFIGYCRVYALRARISALQAFETDIAQLGLMMEYQALPVGELADRLRGALPAAFWQAFRAGVAQGSAREAWRQALYAEAPYGLRASDMEQLCGFGAVLGQGGRAAQKNNVDYALSNIKRLRETLQLEQAKKGGLYGTLGLLSGLAAAILIW